MRHKTLNIKGEFISMEITRKTTKSGLDTLGWSLHAVSNRGLQFHAFLSGEDEAKALIEAEDLVKLRLKILEQKKKSDLLFERIQDLDLEDKKDCFCYFFGAMQDRIEDDDIAFVDKWIEEKKREREEVDVSDCCHSEDVKSIQPPLRSSVQSSPDDPYYVCGSCEQKCELETWKRSELEDERSYESGE